MAISNVRYCLSYEPIKWDFTAFKMNIISISKDFVATDVVNDITSKCYCMCGHMIFMTRITSTS